MRRARPTVEPFTSVVERFEDVAGAVIHETGLARAELPRMATRSILGEPDPRLVAAAHSSTYDLRVAVLPRGRLATNSGVAVSARGELVRETVWDEGHWNRAFRPAARVAPPVRVRGRYAAVITAWYGNYYHWMLEALPRIAVLEASGIEVDGLIVPEQLLPFQRQSLELVGVDLARAVPFTSDHVDVDELVWIAPRAPVQRPTWESIDWLRSRLGAPTVRDPRGRLYLTRPQSRGVTNERELLSIATSSGYDVVDPGSLPLPVQIAMFADASRLAGPHGAAFANGIFSRSLRALEMYQPRHVNSSTVCALLGAGHEHWSVIGGRRARLSRPRHHGMVVPAEQFAATLEAMDR
jgi:hypothetical protein